MKKFTKGVYVVCGLGCAYFLACVGDVIAHNNSDYRYAKWNLFNAWAKDEVVEAETTEEITTEITTEVTTEEITTEKRTTATTTVITTEVTTELSTEIPTTEYFIVEDPEYYTEEEEEYVRTVATYNDAPIEYYSEDVEMLAHLINGEAGAEWCCDITRYYVGSVVLNRVYSDEFPNTIYGVIFQSGQYACTWDGNYDRTPSQRCYEIAEDLLANGSWLPSNVVFQANFEQGSGVYDYVDGVYFCYR